MNSTKLNNPLINLRLKRERDVSMHLGFREELRELLKAKETTMSRVFVRGRYGGGVEEILRIHEEGFLCSLVEGLLSVRARAVCEKLDDRSRLADEERSGEVFREGE